MDGDGNLGTIAFIPTSGGIKTVPRLETNSNRIPCEFYRGNDV
jgi:hypothetical protein